VNDRELTLIKRRLNEITEDKIFYSSVICRKNNHLFGIFDAIFYPFACAWAIDRCIKRFYVNMSYENAMSAINSDWVELSKELRKNDI
jgi:hypothetical protein